MTEIASLKLSNIQLKLEQAALELAPGASAGQLLNLTNQSALLDNFDLTITGPAATWCALSEATVNLFPNWSAPINLEVSVPAGTAPGLYPALLTAAARTQPEINNTVELQITVPGPAVQTPIAPGLTAGVNTVGPAAAEPELAGGGVEISFENSWLSLPAGQSLNRPLTLRNLTAVPNTFQLELSGWPAGWASLSSDSLYLFPNWSESLTLTLAVPAGAAPGLYSGQLAVAATTQPEVRSILNLRLEVPAYPVAPAQPANLYPPPAPDQTTTNFTTPPPAPAFPPANLAPDETSAPTKRPNERSNWLNRFSKGSRKKEPVVPAPHLNITTPFKGEELPAELTRPATAQPKPPSSLDDRPTNKLTPTAAAEAAPNTIEATGDATGTEEAGQPVADAAPVEPVEQPAAVKNAPEATTAPETADEQPARQLELELEAASLTIVAGEYHEQQVKLANLSSLTDTFDLHVEGEANNWANLSCSSMNLFPGWAEEFYLRFEIPRNVAAGRYTGRLYAISHNQSDTLAVAAVEIEVLEPLWKDTGWQANALLENLDLANARLELRLESPALHLQPGQSVEQQVSLFNESAPPGLFELAVEGLPPGWHSFSGSRLNLFPHWKESVYLRFDVPAGARPQTLPARLTATSLAYPQVQAVVEFSLTCQAPAAEASPDIELARPPAPALTLEQRTTEQLHKIELVPATELDVPFETLEAAVESIQARADLPPAGPASLVEFATAGSPAAPAPVVEPEPATTAEEPASVFDRPEQPAEVAPDLAATTLFEAELAEPGLETESAPANAFAPLPHFGIEPLATPDLFVAFEDRPTVKLKLEDRQTNKLKLEDRQTNKLAGEAEEPPPPPVVVTPFLSLQNILPVAPQPTSEPEAPSADYTGQYEATPAAATRRSWWQKLTGRNRPQPAATAPVVIAPAVPAIELFKTITPAHPVEASPSPAPPAPPVSTDGTPRVQISLPRSRLTIVAGESAELPINLTNLTPLPDDFDLTVEGLPANWYSFTAESVNMFPNWNESSGIKLEIGLKVRPSLYNGRVIVTSRSQPGIRGEAPLEIEVLSPLRVEARVHPRRARGFRAKYEVILRNRSMCDATMNLQLGPDSPYCLGQFAPAQVPVAAGGTTHVKLRVNLKPKTPKDQKAQTQPFQVQVQPTFQVAGLPVTTPEMLTEAEYQHESRWSFIGRHPVLFGFGVVILLVVLLWSTFVLPTIQNGFILMADKVAYQGQARNSIRVEQKTFTDTLQNNVNPLAAFTQLQVQFQEEGQRVVISMRSFFISTEIKGQLGVDPARGNLIYTSEKKGQEDSLPWLFAPPDKVVEKLNSKLKRWLISQSPPQRLESAIIEGNTLFLKIRPCGPQDPACS